MTPETAAFLLTALVCAGCAIQLWRRGHEWVGPDEAYLWYGTSRLLAGDVPLRDFRSYEPGRYLWCAPFLHVWARGILTIRVASYLFYAITLSIGVVTLWHHGVSLLALLTLVAISLTAYKECFKLYEPGLCWLWIAAGTSLMTGPTTSSLVMFGFVVGLAATFGMNLLMYTGAGSVVVLGLLALQDVVHPADLLRFAIGALIGALPLLYYVIGVRGFAEMLLERRVRALWRRRATNLPLPVPWPWTIGKGSDRPNIVIGKWCLGVAFIALPVIPIVSILLLIRSGSATTPLNAPALFCAAALGLFIWRHAYSRADIEHVYHSLIPATVTLAMWADRWAHGWLIFAVWWLCVVLWYGGLDRVIGRKLRPTTQRFVSEGWRLDCHIEDEIVVLRVREQLEEASPTAREWLVALPGMLWVLPLLKLRSAVYDTYCLYTATREEQEAMVHEIAASPVEIALIDTAPLDDVPARCFPETHPLVMEWILKHFEAVECGLPEHLLLLKRRPA